MNFSFEMIQMFGWAGVLAGVAFHLALGYWLLTLPLRREYRGRLFLDLLETGLKDGLSPERTIASISNLADHPLGWRISILAGSLSSGVPLTGGLRQVPQLLPQTVVGMLGVGENLGDLRKVLPACRELLTSGKSRSMMAFNFLIPFLFVNAMVVIFAFPLGRILPILDQIVREMGVNTGALGFEGLMVLSRNVLCVLALALDGGIGLYLLAPFFGSWTGGRLKPAWDWIELRFPWRRKRLQQAFSSMLALLLDAGATEEKAMELAAGSTANGWFIRRATVARQHLRAGISLTEAVAALDDSGEFRWRLAQAAHAGTGFVQALAGWHRSLDAKAFQQEQSFSHVVSTALVILQGLIVAGFGVAMLRFFTSVIQTGAAW